MENWSTKSCEKESDKVNHPLHFPSSLLPPRFYSRHTVEVAQDLLGKVLWIQTDSTWIAGRIVETEAYRAKDPASHCWKGPTPRCSIMFDEPGVAYIYYIYGMYEMLNFVTEPQGDPGAVLIRALEPWVGEGEMLKRRMKPQAKKLRKVQREDLCRGPGKLCKALGIELHHNGESLQGPRLFVTDDGFRPQEILKSKRVGIRLGTEKLWRFFIAGSPFVSRTPFNREGIRVSEKKRI